MYVIVVFVVSCLYSAVTLTRRMAPYKNYLLLSSVIRYFSGKTPAFCSGEMQNTFQKIEQPVQMDRYILKLR